MSLNFNKLLSAQAQEALLRKNDTLYAAYAQSNSELGQTLLDLARVARLGCDRGPDEEVYSAQLFWHGIPELARRLGARVGDEPLEHPHWTPLTDQELRFDLGNSIHHTSKWPREISNDPNLLTEIDLAWDVLTGESCNGNLVGFGMDRLCAPDLQNQYDAFTRSLRSVAAGRKIPCEDGRWTPALCPAMWQEAKVRAESGVSHPFDGQVKIDPATDVRPLVAKEPQSFAFSPVGGVVI